MAAASYFETMALLFVRFSIRISVVTPTALRFFVLILSPVHCLDYGVMYKKNNFWNYSADFLHGNVS